MIDFPYLNEVKRTTPSKIIMTVLDGLGGMAHPSYGATELEHARTPVLDKLAGVSSCGVPLLFFQVLPLEVGLVIWVYLAMTLLITCWVEEFLKD